MARVVRKVSNVNSKGKKTFWRLSKKQTIILSSVVGVILVAAAVLTTVLCINNNNSTEETKPDYFLHTEEVSSDLGVTFSKSTYAGAVNYAVAEEIEVEHLFVFGIDTSVFYPVAGKYYDTNSDDEKVDRYVKEQLELYNVLVELQKTIDKAGKQSEEAKANIKLVIVDISKGDGSSLLTATSQDKENRNVKFVESDSTGALCTFTYLQGGLYQNKVTLNENEKVISKTGIEMKNDALQVAINYVNQLAKNYTAE